MSIELITWNYYEAEGAEENEHVFLMHNIKPSFVIKSSKNTTDVICFNKNDANLITFALNAGFLPIGCTHLATIHRAFNTYLISFKNKVVAVTDKPNMASYVYDLYNCFEPEDFDKLIAKLLPKGSRLHMELALGREI